MTGTRRADWLRLLEIAEGQGGLFQLAQAAGCGISKQLLRHHLMTRQLSRVRRGIYRLSGPPAENQGLMVAWLWAAGEGTLSHRTALALHGLADPPAEVQLTVPRSWRSRVRPAGVEVHYEDLAQEDRAWLGGVRVTTLKRTLRDCDQRKEALS